MSLVSVCIVTYNSAQDIITCLEAVIKQSYKHIEIIVVDNASQDGSYETVSTFAQVHRNFTIIQNKVNNGFAGGQNQAISYAKGDYIVVLNPDVELEAYFIERIVNVLSTNNHIGSATGLLKLKSNPTVVDSTGLHMPFNRHAVDRGMGDDVGNWLTSGEVFGPSGAAAVYKRTMIEAIKIDGQFFDEQFFAYKEDVDVAWRAQLLGWKSVYVAEAVGLHARGWKKGGREHISLFVRQHSYINQLYMLIKNEQVDSKFIVRFPVLVGRELMKLAFILLKERDLLSSFKLMSKHYADMIHKRKQIKSMIDESKKVTIQK